MPLFIYDNAARIVTIPAPKTAVTCQELLDDIRDYEDDWVGVDIPWIAEASGKVDLGGGIFVGITLTLVDWKVKFEDRPGPGWVKCEVTGGNLVSWDTVQGKFVDSIAPAAYVSDTRTTSASATIRELEIVNLQRLIEMQRPHHTGTGNIWYWDPYNGDDGNDGMFPERATKTFAKAHDLVVDSNHDIVICYPGNPAGATVTDERITITKRYLFVRGPGRDFQLTPSATDKDTVTIQAEGVEISSLVVNTALSGSRNAIKVDGVDFALLRDVWIDHSQNDGVLVVGSKRSAIECCGIESCGGNGVHVGDNTEHLELRDVSSYGNTGCGVCIVGSGITGVSLRGKVRLYHNGTYGLYIGTGVEDVLVDIEGTIRRNTTEDVYDDGTDTHYSGIDVGEFGGFVHIDVAGGVTGTEYPRGTDARPVNNLSDAKAIAVANGIKSFKLRGGITLDSNFDNYSFQGHTADTSTVAINGQSVAGTSFRDLQLTGQCNGAIRCWDCRLTSVTDLSGVFTACSFVGTFSIKSGELVHTFDAFSWDMSPMTVDMNGNGIFVYYGCGQWVVTNLTDPAGLVAFSGNIGVTLEASVTDGFIYITSETVLLADNKTGGTLVKTFKNSFKVWEELLADHQSEGSLGAAVKNIKAIETGRWRIVDGTPFPQMVYLDEDNVTEVARFDLKDKDGNPIDLSQVLIHDKVRV